MKKRILFYYCLAVCIVILFCISFSFAQTEQVTITTFYPSPFGSYNQLRANRLRVGNNTPAPTRDGEVRWGGSTNSKGALTPDQGASIELGGSGTPYIDFSNDTTSDYDARIFLYDNDTLRFNVQNRVEIRASDSSWRDLEVRDIYICP